MRVPTPPPVSQPPLPVDRATELPHASPERATVTARSLRSPQGCSDARISPWLECAYLSSSGETLRYFLYLPATENASGRLPIVTFLHGSSGSGPGDGKPLEGGHRFGSNLWIRDDAQARYPSIVVVPQVQPPPGETWARAWRAASAPDGKPKEALVLLVEALDQLADELPVDSARLYLTGQSMGGFGAWLAYTRYPGRFAAIVPVCGGGDPGAVVPNGTAVWAFHGDRDQVVPPSRSREMVDAIRRAGGMVRYTEFPGMGHNIFEAAYGEAELVDWLFAQRLPGH
ncbi:MAG: hypothetical protein KIT83_05735 [Bryobacterales bacterium]|nr:hypothetical protein [Bryobacterales bacterium]